MASVSGVSEMFRSDTPPATNFTATLLRKMETDSIPMAFDLNGLEDADNICKERMLVEASFAGDLEVIHTLLKTNISVDAEEYNNFLFCASKIYMTPLQIAAARGWWQGLQVFIEKGADLNAKDRFDVTATHMAAEQGHYLVLKILLEAGANCNVATKYFKKGFKTVSYYKGTTPLHLAASNNHVTCVKELIYFGADYNAVDEIGRTSLFIAAQAGYDACVLAQLRNAIGRDILSLPGYESGDTPLHFAVRRGMLESVRELLKLGSDVNHQNFSGSSPLHLCVSTPMYNHDVTMEILKLLVLTGHNTDVNLSDSVGLTPLHYVAFSTASIMTRRPDMAKFLIALGASVNISNHQGLSLIHYEYNSIDPDVTILKAAIDTMCMPPAPAKLKDLHITVDEHAPPNHMLTVHSFWLALRRGVDPEIEFGNIAHNIRPGETNKNNLKQTWYNNIASKPPRLMNVCRHVIRKQMGPKRLRYVVHLPLPTFLKSYVLLGIDV